MWTQLSVVFTIEELDGPHSHQLLPPITHPQIKAVLSGQHIDSESRGQLILAQLYSVVFWMEWAMVNNRKSKNIGCCEVLPIG